METTKAALRDKLSKVPKMLYEQVEHQLEKALKDPDKELHEGIYKGAVTTV